MSTYTFMFTNRVRALSRKQMDYVVIRNDFRAWIDRIIALCYQNTHYNIHLIICNDINVTNVIKNIIIPNNMKIIYDS